MSLPHQYLPEPLPETLHTPDPSAAAALRRRAALGALRARAPAKLRLLALALVAPAAVFALVSPLLSRAQAPRVAAVDPGAADLVDATAACAGLLPTLAHPLAPMYRQDRRAACGRCARMLTAGESGGAAGRSEAGLRAALLTADQSLAPAFAAPHPELTAEALTVACAERRDQPRGSAAQ